MKKIYLVANQKGGCCKTSTATAMARILNKRGYKTLLVDTDMQRNSTDTYRAEYEGVATLYDVLFDDAPITEAIQTTDMGDIVAADPLLRKAEMNLGTDASLIGVLRDQLQSLTGYDYIVIDSGPTLGNMLYACVLAADAIIIPSTTDRYAIQGLADFSATIKKVERGFGKSTPIDGILIVKYDPRTNLSRELAGSLEEIVKTLNTKVYNTRIREAVKLREAQTMRMPLVDYAPHSKPALDYIEWIDEEILEG